MPESFVSTFANSSPVASRSVGFCEGVRTRCRPSAASASPGAMALTERNQALEAAVRLLRYAERRARLVVLDQAPGPEGHQRTRVRFTELDPQGDPVGEPRELTLDGDEVYVDTLVIKFEDNFVIA